MVGMDAADDYYETMTNSMQIIIGKTKRLEKMWEDLYGKERKFIPSEFNEKEQELYEKIGSLTKEVDKDLKSLMKYWENK